MDLTAVFSRTYDIGSYDLVVDYSKAPSVQLTDAEMDWVDSFLKSEGLRPVEKV